MDTLQEAGTATVALRPDGTVDINETARATLEAVLNAVMDEQASELGAQRNGYRERGLDTCVGRVTLRIPKLRQGTYFPDDVVRRWSRTDAALAQAVCEMWERGVSTRKVDAVAAEMGLEGMSRSRVSRLCAPLDAEVRELREGQLSSVGRPYLWLDATYVPVREGGRVRRLALVTAVAAARDGSRAVVGLECVDTESHLSWRDFLLSLRRRGLSGVELCVSDAHEGLVRALGEVFPGSSWQRCVTHLERNVAEWCRRKRVGGAAVAALKAALAERDPELVREGWSRACGLLASEDAAAGARLEEATPFALAYLGFPREHRNWIRTNNVQERMNCEIKRRTRVVQVFPSKESLVRLAGAVCLNQNDAWLGSAYFMDPRGLEPGYESEPLPPAGDAERQRCLSAVEGAFRAKAGEAA